MLISSHAQFKICVNKLSSVYLKFNTPDTQQVGVCISRASTRPITLHAYCNLGIKGASSMPPVAFFTHLILY